jgi:hypothetical protein
MRGTVVLAIKAVDEVSIGEAETSIVRLPRTWTQQKMALKIDMMVLS